MNIIKTIFSLSILLITLNTFSQSTKDCWPIFRGDNQFLGITECEIPDNFSLQWLNKTKEEIKSSPIICNGKIYVATGAGSIVCLNLSGEILWKISKEASFEASPLIDDNTLFIGSLEGSFFALDASNGKTKWNFKADNQIIGSANIFNSGKNRGLVFGCYDNNLYCLNPANGEKKWNYESDNYINGAPTISNGQIVFGGCDSYLHVVGIDGKSIKKIELGTYIASSAAFFNNTVFLGNYDGEFMSASIEKSNVNWRVNLNRDASVISSPSLINNKIIIGARDQRIHCLEANSGKILWTFKTLGNVDASTIVNNKKVLACSLDGRVYIIDINTGKEIYSFDLGSPISGTPAIVDGLIVVAAENGNIYGFKY